MFYIVSRKGLIFFTFLAGGIILTASHKLFALITWLR
jgi:hypothetical protein